jgi:formate dehydrogenase iron-sulfur subunit
VLRDLCDTMVHASLCALGGMTPYPVTSALEHFPEDFGLDPRTMPDQPGTRS